MRLGTSLYFRLFIFIFFTFLSFSNFAYSKINSVSTKNTKVQTKKWHFIVAPYAWIFGIKGDLTIKGQVANLGITPADVLDSIKDIDAIGEVHVEAIHGPLTLLFDTTYLKLTKMLVFGPFGATITPALGITDFGAYYTVAQHKPPGSTRNDLTLQAFGGGLYFYMATRIRPLKLPNVADHASFVAPILGARLIWRLTHNLRLIFRGTYGGFDVDDAKSTWGASAMGFYQFHKNWYFAGGYRWLDIDFSRGEGINEIGINAKMSGPVAGLSVRF